MPYVKSEYRAALDPAIRDLARGIADLAKTLPDETAFAGMLNYACTSLAMQVVELRFGKMRYGTIATVTGVFKNIADEFYRRVASPYEDRQIEVNGDVPLYAELVRRIAAATPASARPGKRPTGEAAENGREGKRAAGKKRA